MTLKEIFFYFFSLGAVVSAVGVIRSRSAVYSVLWLVLAMCFTAGLFALLGAFLVAAVQVLVYAGAILVLFLFIVMLMDIRQTEPEGRSSALAPVLPAALSAAALALILWAGHSVKGAGLGASGSPANLARLLFKDYALPFELTSFLLLAAVVSIVVLAKKDAS